MDPYVFPFDVPADLTTLDADALQALLAQVREHSQGFRAASPAEATADAVTALTACRDLARTIVGELNARTTAASDAADRATQLADLAGELDDLEPAPAPDPEPAPGDAPAAEPGGENAAEPAQADATASVTAAGRPPRVRDVARRAGPPALPAPTRTAAPAARLRASADVPGFTSGQELHGMAEVSQALANRIARYPRSAARVNPPKGGWQNKRPIEVYDPDNPSRKLTLSNFVRHSVVQIQREFPDDLRVTDDTRGWAVAEHAANERRLPGGNLRASVEAQLRAGNSLTAAVGWCAPSATIYDLLEMESTDGILDLPQLQTTRGGWQIPEHGGPDFATIFTELGNAGDTHLSEAQVISGTAKVCTEIACPDFVDVRLGVDYICLTGSLLQSRGYPEAVARFTRGARVGLEHKINKGVISAMVAASGAAIVINQDLSGDDAVSAVLAAVELAIVDAKYRNRMTFNGTMEIVLPMWVLATFRAAMSRRTAAAAVNVTDAQILDWFTTRKAVPHFVYDWQDYASGLTTGPGQAAGLAHLPPTAQFLVYPSGTWVKAVQDVIELDTIYDSTLLETNQFTALFDEDGWALLQMSPISRLYTVNVDQSGVVGCCSTVGS